MICDNLRIIKGNVAEYNTFPVFSPSNEKKYFLSGRYRDQREQIIIADKLLTMGLLFLGDAGQGKTNTMLSLTGKFFFPMKVLKEGCPTCHPKKWKINLPMALSVR